MQLQISADFLQFPSSIGDQTRLRHALIIITASTGYRGSGMLTPRRKSQVTRRAILATGRFCSLLSSGKVTRVKPVASCKLHTLAGNDEEGSSGAQRRDVEQPEKVINAGFDDGSMCDPRSTRFETISRLFFQPVDTTREICASKSIDTCVGDTFDVLIKFWNIIPEKYILRGERFARFGRNYWLVAAVTKYSHKNEYFRKYHACNKYLCK